VTSKEIDMKPKFSTLVAITIGAAILMSTAADAGNRGSGIAPNEAQRLRYQVQQYHKMQRIAGADGQITRAEYARLKNQSPRAVLAPRFATTDHDLIGSPFALAWPL